MTTRLKSIELQGYKTFANKTRFEFPARITAIVGPNGSGKSNIADAIRWVLGEQSFTLLRGRKTVDMIFTGSDQKARAGMASASILFNNQDHWLPIDYEEVQITRRAFRDGDNEYLINGQKVRLRDINELLGQSGLAERTYTIIGQGAIDNALSLKPDDRRRFFEEAAGIGLFRSRREEALNRLDATRRNMERINDILSELEPRVHSLERQSRKAADYERIKTGLKTLLREWYGFHWHYAQENLVSALERHRAQEEKTEQMRRELAACEEKMTRLQETVRSERLGLSDLHNRLSEAHHRLEQTTRETAVLDERLSAANQQAAGVRSDSDLLSADLELLQTQTGKIAAELTALNQTSAEALAEKETYERELQEKQNELRQLQKDRSEKHRALNTIENSLVRFATRREEFEGQIASLTQGIETQKTAAAEALSALATAQAEQQAGEANLKEAESSLAEITAQREALRRELQTLEKERAGLQSEKNQAEAGLAKAAAQLNVLEDAERSLSGLNQGAQFLAKIAKQGRIKQNLRSLDSRFVIPKEYEVAAAAALGENLDAILTDPQDWRQLMDLLRSGNNGRAVLLAEHYQPQQEGPEASGQPAGLPSLLDRITFNEESRPLAERLFRHIFLAESRERAITAQPALRIGQSIVTPEGDVFHANGSVISGTETRHQIFARTREREEIRGGIRLAEESVNRLSADLQGITQRISAAQDAERQAGGVIAKAGAELDTIRKNNARLTLEIQKKEQSAAFMNQRMQEAARQIQAATESMAQDQTQSAALETERSELQKTIQDLSAAIHQIQLDELQNQVHHWTLEWTVAQKTIREVQTRLADLEGRILKDQQKKEEAEKRIASTQRQIEEIGLQRVTLQTTSSELTEHAAAIEAEIAPEEVLLAGHEAELSVAQTESQLFRERTSAAEKTLSQTQLDVARQNDNLDTLKAKIEDDFGLVALDYSAQIPGQTPLPLGDMVDRLPRVEQVPDELEEQISRQKSLLYRMGAVNPEAIEEYKTVRERFTFLQTQKNDLEKADRDLRKVVEELDGMMKNAFQETFEKVQIEFRAMFTRLFGGGSAKLVLTEPDDLTRSGIDIEAKLPGHREQELSLLSGGERSLTSVALVFALLRVSPTPFCVLDEVDAALDEANVGRFCELLKELGRDTQFIVVTHNRNTVETADVIYGITMGRNSASQSVSLRLDEVSKDVLN